MTDALKKAIEEADAACPCRSYNEQNCGIAPRPCSCSKPVLMAYSGTPERKDVDDCDWPGHAAIRTVARVALEEAAQRVQACDFASGNVAVDKAPAAAARAFATGLELAYEEIRALMPGDSDE